VLLSWVVMFQLSMDVLWLHYLDDVLHFVQAAPGPVTLESSPFAQRPFVWGWSMPRLSMAVSAIYQNSTAGVLAESLRGLLLG